VARLGETGDIASYGVFNIGLPASDLNAYVRDRLRFFEVAKNRESGYHLQYFADDAASRGLNRFSAPPDISGETDRGYAHWMINRKDRLASMLALSGKAMIRKSRTKAVLRMVLPHLHQVLVRALRGPERKHLQGGPALTPREKEVIRWLKEGKTSWDISRILGMSERTVNFHASNIIRKLDAASRTHAVAVAMEKGLIGD
jgi:DNA-binding CsgD family transcriptional regulator